MAFPIALFISLVLLALAVMQITYVVWYWRILFGSSSKQGPQPTDDHAASDLPIVETKPTVALVLCLRGDDPSLVDCLSGISAQDYENFRLFVVVDDRSDPALEVVNEFFKNDIRHAEMDAAIFTIEERRESCSLKCSAILTALERLPSGAEIIAFIDADTVPDQNWLNDLIEPFSDPMVGATTGNRWFAPGNPTLGSCLRQAWNAAAIVQMNIYNIPWGGTLAIRKSAIAKCGLKEKWGNAFCEDTMLTSVLENHQLKLVRVPNLICENTESTTVGDAYRWIHRQLLTVRLHNPKWPLVLGHGIATAFAILAPLLALMLFYQFKQPDAFLLMVFVLAGYQLVNLMLVWLISIMNERTIDARDGFNHQSRRNDHPPHQVLSCFLVQVVYPLACYFAATTQQVRWREIEYQIEADNQIKLTKYLPFVSLTIDDAGSQERLRSID